MLLTGAGSWLTGSVMFKAVDTVPEIGIRVGTKGAGALGGDMGDGRV